MVGKTLLSFLMFEDLATQRDALLSHRASYSFQYKSQVTPSANTLILMSLIGVYVNKLNHRALSSTIYNFAKGVAWASNQLSEKEGKRGKFAHEFFMHN